MTDPDRVDKACAKAVLGLVLAILIFSPLATGAVRPQDFVVVQWLTVALVAVWCVRFVLNPKHRLLWAPVCWGVLLFIAYGAVRYAQADVEYAARREFLRLLVYGVLFYAIVTNLHKQNTTQIVAGTLIVVAAVISMYAITQFLSESNRVWHFIRPEAYAKRGSGTFICPNNLAGYLEMILPLGLAYTLTGRFEHVTKVLAGYCSLVIFAGIAVTVSRAGWLATVLTMMVLFFWLLRQRGYRMQAVAVLVVMVAIGTVFGLKATFSKDRNDSLKMAIEAEDYRFRLWGPAWQIWQDHFWWGVGPAHFEHRFGLYRPADDQLQKHPERVHNDYLNTLVDWGLAGGALIAAIWIAFYWEVFRTWRYVQRAPNDLTTKRSNKTSLVMGACLGLLAILIHSAFDFNMHIPANAILAVTLMALVTGHFRFATERYWITLHWPLRIAVLLALFAAGGYLGAQAWRQTRELYWLGRARDPKASSADQVRALENAMAVEPGNPQTPYDIGERLRLYNWQGEPTYLEPVETALLYYERGMQLNRHDPYNPLRYGMCLDWLKRHDQAAPFFEQAKALDPNNYYILANVGWHHVQAAEAAEEPALKHAAYEKARIIFHQSLQMRPGASNPIAHHYYQIVLRKLAELESAPGQDAYRH
ncbi:MAG: O-antigen ligase family protein [Verrucomicrobia bacterium]|nr:O-antigen ligase family protein [Verrucomicrobiota bacterium]